MYPKWFCEEGEKDMGYGIEFTRLPLTWVTVQLTPFSFASVGVRSLRDVKWAVVRLMRMYT